VLSACGKRRGAAELSGEKGSGPQSRKVGYLSAIDVLRHLPRSEIERVAETTTSSRPVHATTVSGWRRGLR